MTGHVNVSCRPKLGSYAISYEDCISSGLDTPPPPSIPQLHRRTKKWFPRQSIPGISEYKTRLQHRKKKPQANRGGHDATTDVFPHRPHIETNSSVSNASHPWPAVWDWAETPLHFFLFSSRYFGKTAGSPVPSNVSTLSGQLRSPRWTFIPGPSNLAGSRLCIVGIIGRP